MSHSMAAVLLAAGSALVVGAIALALLYRFSSRSTIWAVRLAPLVAVASIWAGVVTASLTMLLEPQQAWVIALVLAVSTTIAVMFGVIAGRRVAALQQEAAEHAAARQRDREVEDRRRELITWLSHDIRTPLARMRALTEANEDGLAPPDYATRMTREVDGLAVIVEDLATLSRLQGTAGQLHIENIDLSDLVSDVVADNQPLAHRLNITLQGASRGSAEVFADPTELGRAINNLIVNALRHTRPDGFVAVTVDESGGNVTVSARDQCGGIPDEHMGRLFEAGWRGTSARTPGDSGAGLGLTITHRVVDAHKGSLTVRNTEDGCEFTIDLPRRSADHSRDDSADSLSNGGVRLD